MATFPISTEVLQDARAKAAEFRPLCEEVGIPVPRSYRFPHWAQMQEVDIKLHQDCVEQGLIGVGQHFIDDILPALRESKDADIAVLITGETGTGKEVVARCIHALGSRGKKVFQAINCGGLPPELLESELFGYKKGAFTGATCDRTGAVEVADGGTLFLDEIGDMPMSLQVKLLRFLNDQSFIRVGDTETRKVDVRIVAATNRDTQTLIASEQIRTDLFYRISGIEIYLWPLYLRPEDLPLLIYCFIQEYNKGTTCPIEAVTQGFLKEALLYRWPGNIRELKNSVTRACHTAQWQRDEKNLLIGLGLLPPVTSRERKEMCFLVERVPLQELPVFSARKFLEKMDAVFSATEQRQWTIGSRAVKLNQEKEGSKEQQDPIDALLEQGLHLPDIERQYIIRLMKTHSDNISAVARQAGVHRDKVKRIAGIQKSKR